MNADITDNLTERERRLVQLIGEGKYSFAGCMMRAGYSRSTACSNCARVRRIPRVRAALIQDRVKRGKFVSDEELAFVGLSAKAVTSQK